MAVRLDVHPGAREDYLEALDWYLDRSHAVASRFQDELNQVLNHICTWPELAAADEEGIRCESMHRFPHIVYYRVLDENNVQVLAVAHGRRRPKYWQSRLE